MYWVLHIVGRDVRGNTDSAIVQLCNTLTCIPLFEGLCVCLSPAGSSVAVLGILENTRIPHALKSIFLLIACWHHLGNHVKFVIYLYFLGSTPLGDFSSRVTSLFEFRDLYFAYSNLKPLT